MMGDKRCIAVRRVPSGGKAISPASSGMGVAVAMRGKVANGAIRWATEIFRDFGDVACVNADLADVDGVLIIMAEQNKPGT